MVWRPLPTLYARAILPSRHDVNEHHVVPFESPVAAADEDQFAAGIEQFVFVSSLCVSRFFHPLNLFWLILWWKQQAEQYLKASGLNYTIVRPGGLKNEDNLNPVVMSGADTLFDGSIPRQKVAQVCVESLTNVRSQNKVLEVISQPTAVAKSWEDLFASV